MLIKNEDEFEKDPWDRFDSFMGRVRDGLAAVGVLTLIAVAGFAWERFL